MKILPQLKYETLHCNSVQSNLPPNLIFQEILQERVQGTWFEASLDFSNQRNEFSYLAINPEFIISRNSTQKLIDLTFPKQNKTDKIYYEDFFSFLSEIEIWHKSLIQNLNSSVNDYSRFPFVAGFFGYFSYDLKNEIENLKVTNVNNQFFDSVLCFFSEVIAYEYSSSTYHIFSLCENKKTPNSKLFQKLEDKKIQRQSPRYTQKKESIDRLIKNYTISLEKKKYKKAFAQIKDSIESGKIYQACLTSRFQKPYECDPVEDFCNLRSEFLTPFTSYFHAHCTHILSFSVESFLKIQKNTILSRPVKGTVIRKKNTDDQKLKEFLLQNRKEISENYIIVDLIRNDIGKIAKIGKVKVSELLKIESYKTVHQLVSEISGEFSVEKKFGEILKSMFPGGSMTGAPKIEAMNIIDTVESCTRGIYSGAIGFIDLRGGVELNMTIRTAIIKDNTLSFHSGGGIVYDSQLEKEWDELIGKSEFFLRYF